MWQLKTLIQAATDTTVQINSKYVPARPINYKYRSLSVRIREAWAVFTGKADCFMWPENQ